MSPELRFVFRLAGHLGMFAEDVLKNMSWTEFEAWMIFHNVEPFGDDYRQTGRICASIYNASGNMKKSIDEDNFLPIHKAKLSVEQQLERWASLPDDEITYGEKL